MSGCIQKVLTQHALSTYMRWLCLLSQSGARLCTERTVHQHSISCRPIGGYLRRQRYPMFLTRKELILECDNVRRVTHHHTVLLTSNPRLFWTQASVLQDRLSTLRASVRRTTCSLSRSRSVLTASEYSLCLSKA